MTLDSRTTSDYTSAATNCPVKDTNISSDPNSQPTPVDWKIYFEYGVLLICVVGAVANALMLFVLAYFKENRQSTTNVLILNQTSVDLASCIAVLVSQALKINGFHYTGDVYSNVICFVFHGNLLQGVGMSASICGLIVIALERYVKIVHPLLHKKYYRKWMLYATVACPWIYGLVSCLPVVMPTTVIINGQCYPLAMWPTPAHKLLYGIYVILFNFCFPVIIFTYCYGRIALVIRRRLNMNREAGRARMYKVDKRRRNVVKTLVTVSVVFAACWLPIQIYFIMLNAGYELDITSKLWYMSLFISFINPMLNPLMYAWQYETVRESIRLIVDSLRGVSVSKVNLDDVSYNDSGDNPRVRFFRSGGGSGGSGSGGLSGVLVGRSPLVGSLRSHLNAAPLQGDLTVSELSEASVNEGSPVMEVLVDFDTRSEVVSVPNDVGMPISSIMVSNGNIN